MPPPNPPTNSQLTTVFPIRDRMVNIDHQLFVSYTTESPAMPHPIYGRKNMTPDAIADPSAAANDPPPAQRILIVDDDAMVRSTLNLALQRDGFETVTAATVKEALQQIGS